MSQPTRALPLFGTDRLAHRTNASSTDLNIRLDAITRALPKSSRSAPLSTPLVQAIREKGSAIIPEHRIYFTFSALNVLVAGSTRGLSASGLSDHAQQTLALATASKGKAIVNSAVSGQIDECLTLMHGLGQLSEVCVANPKPLDVAIWKVGGIAVALRLIELAKTEKQLETTVQLFIEVVRESWRNSEDAGECATSRVSCIWLITPARRRADAGVRDPRASPPPEGLSRHGDYTRRPARLLRIRFRSARSIGCVQHSRLPLPRA